MVAIVLAFLAIIYPTTIGLPATYVLMALAILAAIIFPVIYLVQHPKEGLRTFIGVAAIAVVVLICWAIADDAAVYGTVAGERDQLLADSDTAKLVGGGVFALLAALGIAVVALVVAEVKSLLD